MAAAVMTTRELAAYLQVHVSTIYRLLRRSDFPRFKIGSDWRFLRSQIDEWMVDAVKEQDERGSTLREVRRARK